MRAARVFGRAMELFEGDSVAAARSWLTLGAARARRPRPAGVCANRRGRGRGRESHRPARVRHPLLRTALITAWRLVKTRHAGEGVRW